MQKYKTLINNILKPYSAVLFLNNSFAGLILLCITFVNPSVAISGVAAVIFTIIFAEFLALKDVYSFEEFYIYNSLLVGMGIGYIFHPSFISVALVAISSIFTFMVSFMLNRIFSTYKIPILSLPFSLVTMFVYLASLKYSGLLSTLVNNKIMSDIEVNLVLSGFFKSIGSIFFLPSNIAGILIFVLILYYSRITALMAIIGFYFGVFVHALLIGSYAQAISEPYSFNYILVAVTLCGIFLLPTIKSFFLALIGVAISVVLTDAISILFNYYSIPVFTIPFNITVIVFIFILSFIYYKELNLNIKATPEKSLSAYLSKIFRFGEITTKISLPFMGEWLVYQAEDDKWTHQGHYKHAYDFIQVKDGCSYMNDGKNIEDYYCFGNSVLAPISGYVVDARDDLEDNRIGEVDHINNWGNYIIIKSEAGFFVEISHLMHRSLCVRVGDYIKEGTQVAKCGNSGYSPEPHIHVQVQDVGVIGGFTRKFCFSEHYKENNLILNSSLNKHDIVSSFTKDKYTKSKLLFILDEIYSYTVYKDDEKIGEFEFVVKINELGEFYFEDKSKSKLFFYHNSKQFYFYNYVGEESHLKWLFILAPRIPFTNKSEITYKDYLPLNLVRGKVRTMFIELLSTVKKDLYKVEKSYFFNNSTISCDYGEVQMESLNKGFSLIKYKNIELRRVL